MKTKSLLLLCFLLIILAFIVGFRAGQQVEKTNKLDLPKPTIIVTPTITYTEYKSKKWGLKFVYPESFKIIESSKEAQINLIPVVDQQSANKH